VLQCVDMLQCVAVCCLSGVSKRTDGYLPLMREHGVLKCIAVCCSTDTVLQISVKKYG